MLYILRHEVFFENRHHKSGNNYEIRRKQITFVPLIYSSYSLLNLFDDFYSVHLWHLVVNNDQLYWLITLTIRELTKFFVYGSQLLQQCMTSVEKFTFVYHSMILHLRFHDFTADWRVFRNQDSW